jgi:Ras-related protein Ral-A
MSKVGKTCLVNRFVGYNAPEEYDPTLEDKVCSKILGRDNILYDVEILDTSGKEENFKFASWLYFADGIFLVFSLTDKKSFDDIKRVHEKMKRFKSFSYFPLILVGNKHDLSDKRQVEFSDAKKLADSWGIEYIETSSITNYNCKESVQRLIDKIKENNIFKDFNSINKKSCPICIII